MHRKLVGVLLALSLAAGACGGSKGDDVKTSSRRTTTTDAGTGTTLAGTDVEAATATTVKSGSTATTAGSKSVAPKSTAAPSADPNAAPGPAATGTYDYLQQGTTNQGAVPPNGTMVVSGSGPSQVFARKADSNNEADLYMNFTSHGPFLTKVVLKQQGILVNCAFDAPVAAPPWPADTGKTFNGHATCDNGFVADFNGSITGHGSDSVGGKAFDTVIVDSTLHVFGNGVDVTVKDTQHWAPALRVPTYSHEVVNGTGPFGVVITGNVTSTLKSASPH